MATKLVSNEFVAMMDLQKIASTLSTRGRHYLHLHGFLRQLLVYRYHRRGDQRLERRTGQRGISLRPEMQFASSRWSACCPLPLRHWFCNTRQSSEPGNARLFLSFTHSTANTDQVTLQIIHAQLRQAPFLRFAFRHIPPPRSSVSLAPSQQSISP